MTEIAGRADDPGPPPERPPRPEDAEGSREDRVAPPVRLARRLRSGVESFAPAAPFFGGFGFGAVAMLAFFWSDLRPGFGPGWLLGALLTGLVYRHNRLLSFVGFAWALTMFWWVDGLLYPYECRGEGCGLGKALGPVVFSGLLVLAAVTIALPRLFAPGRLPVDRWLRGAAAIGGAVALSLAFRTSVQVGASQFEVSLPVGWSVVDYSPYASRDPTYGEDYTAVLGEVATAPGPENTPTTPVLGITVIRGGAPDSPADCQSSAAGFGSEYVLYQPPFEPGRNVMLPAGPAYELVRLPAEGSRTYSWGLSRSQVVGVLPLYLCYIFVVTIPPDSEMTEADATAIVSAIRLP